MSHRAPVPAAECAPAPTRRARLARLVAPAVLVLASPALAACNTMEMLDSVGQIEGSGNVVEEAREVDAFTRLDVGGAVTADVAIGAEQSVVIRSDDNILAIFETVVEGDTLHVRPKQGRYNLDTTDGVHVTITVPELEGVNASGAATVAVDEVGPGAFDVQASGAADVTVGTSRASALSLNASGASEIAVGGGAASTLVAELNGASSLDVVDVKADRVTVEASGASHAQVTAIDDLDVTLSGASSLCYTGEPGHIASEVTGGSSLDPCS